MPLRVQVLFFDMNSFFASVAQQQEPALIGKPVAVMTTDAPGAACIAASTEAKHYGIKMGTRKIEAQKICPNIAFRVAQHDVYVAYHHAIRQAAEQIIPIDKAHSVDEFSCHLMGRQQDLQTALQLARQLQHAILHHVGPAMRCSVGVAPTRLLAKIAAELEKPAGVNWLHPSVLPDKIAHLDLYDLPGISRGMGPRLHAANITTLQDLYAISPKQARFIWGNVTGERFLQELQGRPAQWPRSKGKSIGHGQVLTGENRTPAGARLVLRRLLVKAAARLRREGKYAGALSITVKCHHWGRQSRMGHITPTQDSLFLLRCMNEYWHQMRIRRPISVGVTLSSLTPEDALTTDLFADGNMPAPRKRLYQSIDTLNRKYGQDTVRIGELPPLKVAYTGAKIAFDRIPDWADFYE